MPAEIESWLTGCNDTLVKGLTRSSDHTLLKLTLPRFLLETTVVRLSLANVSRRVSWQSPEL